MCRRPYIAQAGQSLRCITHVSHSARKNKFLALDFSTPLALALLSVRERSYVVARESGGYVLVDGGGAGPERLARLLEACVPANLNPCTTDIERSCGVVAGLR